ncbi:MAG: prepilin-type N-terminal cleavage/methylation domain-containing protein [Finegoldia sp.]|nr:prepilin-type N-terminal cleavage/methylation domain-containing protein [Finegoldia sp.]
MKFKGFTYIELLVTLFILTILMGIVTARFNISDRLNSRTELNTLVTDLETARSLAQNSGKNVEIVMSKDSYKLVCGGSTTVVERPIKYIRIDLKNSSPVFSNYSAPYNHSNIYVKANNKNYKINFMIGTGRIKVSEINE